MEGDVTAAIAFVKLDVALGQEFGRCNHVGSFRIAPESDDGGVLQQQQHVADLVRFSQFNQLLLQSHTGGVINGAELDERDQCAFAWGVTRIHGDQGQKRFLPESHPGLS